MSDNKSGQKQELKVISVHTVKNPDKPVPERLLKADARRRGPKPDVTLWKDGGFAEGIVPTDIEPGIFWAVCEGFKERQEMRFDPKSLVFVTPKQLKASKAARSLPKPVEEKRERERPRRRPPEHVNYLPDDDGREGGRSSRSIAELPPYRSCHKDLPGG